VRRALLSNVWGDLDAFEAVLRNIDLRNDRGAGIGEIICLGNVVGFGPQPRECLELARKRCSAVLAGKQERALLRKATQPGWQVNEATGHPEPGAREGLLWALQQLFGDQIRVAPDDAAIRDLLLDVRAPDYETRLARDISAKLDHLPEFKQGTPKELFERLLTHTAGRGLVLKFIHRTRIRREAEDWLGWAKSLPATLQIDDLPLTPDLDVGSVGLSATAATYTIRTDGRMRLVRVPLANRDRLIRAMEDAGLPAPLR
jgi:hypothetical protein